ncbi:MAG: PAS domain-containing protein [Bradyrhizobiaceae bacterium]|nr:PAS domain-containing protein [Bradyrhizobiaceae bacterium]
MSESQNVRGSRLAEAIIFTIRQPLLVLNAELRVERANPAFYKLFNVKPEETSGCLVYELGNGQWNIQELRYLLEVVMAGEEHAEDFRVDHEFEDIGRRIMLLNARRIEGDDQRPHLILLAITDVTDLERIRFELEGQKEYAEKLTDSVREALVVLGWDLRVKHANAVFYDTFKVQPEETKGRMIYDLGNGQWNIPELRQLLENILPERNSFDDYQVEHDFETLGRRIMLLNARRLDHMDLIVLAIRDVTEKVRNEAQERARVGELQHRVKNIFANVQSIFSLSRRYSLTLEDFTASFEDRLAALARTKDLLLSTPSNSVEIGELVRCELAVHARDRGKVTLQGPPVDLPSRTAQAISMAIHELVTNAVKYGALLHEGGSIEVRWRTEKRDGEEFVVFQWREHGVPMRTAATRKGFGSELIEHTLPYALTGSGQLTFHSDGAECIIEFPLL